MPSRPLAVHADEIQKVYQQDYLVEEIIHCQEFVCEGMRCLGIQNYVREGVGWWRGYHLHLITSMTINAHMIFMRSIHVQVFIDFSPNLTSPGAPRPTGPPGMAQMPSPLLEPMQTHESATIAPKCVQRLYKPCRTFVLQYSVYSSYQ